MTAHREQLSAWIFELGNIDVRAMREASFPEMAGLSEKIQRENPTGSHAADAIIEIVASFGLWTIDGICTGRDDFRFERFLETHGLVFV